MAIEQFHSKNDEPKDDQPICCFEALPEMEEELAAYFPLVYDKKNKNGTSIVIRLSTKHSHVEWKKLLEKDPGAQNLKLYLGVHNLPIKSSRKLHSLTIMKNTCNCSC